MFAEISTYVQQCDVCAQANTDQKTKIPLQPLPVPTGPLDRLHMDILCISTASQKAGYIIVRICAVNKYVIAT